MGWEAARDYPQSEVEGAVNAAGAVSAKGLELMAPAAGAGKTEELIARITGLEAVADIRKLRSIYTV